MFASNSLLGYQLARLCAGSICECKCKSRRNLWISPGLVQPLWKVAAAEAVALTISVFYTVDMCGRYRRRSDKQRIAEAFQVGAGLEDLYLEPDDDVAPGSIQPVVLTNDAGEREIAPMRWGFKLPDRLLFNARSEEVAQSRFWKDSFQERRCIVPADAIFEWQKAGAARKIKYEIGVRGREPFGMAGVWKLWRNPKTDQWERTFAVLTGEPNEVVAPIHNRMTTILEPRDYGEYLAPAERPPVHLLRIVPAEEMRADRVDAVAANSGQMGLFDETCE